MSIVKITKEIQEEAIQTTRTVVNLFLLRYKRIGCVADAKRSGRKTDKNCHFFLVS